MSALCVCSMLVVSLALSHGNRSRIHSDKCVRRRRKEAGRKKLPLTNAREKRENCARWRDDGSVTRASLWPIRRMTQKHIITRRQTDTHTHTLYNRLWIYWSQQNATQSAGIACVCAFVCVCPQLCTNHIIILRPAARWATRPHTTHDTHKGKRVCGSVELHF